MSVTDQPWKRVVLPGSYTEEWWYNGQRPIDVFVEIEHQFQRNQKWELSFTGVVGPKANGDAVGGCGQISLHGAPAITTFAEGWDRLMLDVLRGHWDRYHLNGMRAGSPDQEAYLRTIKHLFPGYPTSYYDWASDELAKMGLNPDPNFDHPTRTVEKMTVSAAHGVVRTQEPTPYRYGHAWIYEDVPEHVLTWLYNLPIATKLHPWGDRDRFITEES